MTEYVVRGRKRKSAETSGAQADEVSSKVQPANSTIVGALEQASVSPPIAPDRSNEPREGETFGSEFLDNIAHQMVAPLQSIDMHCTNIIEGIVPPDQAKLRLGEVVGHARILAELSRRMRFIHELVTGKVIETEVLEFRHVVSTWIDGFNNYMPLLRKRNVDVDIDHPMMNKLPNVLGSKLAAHQVIMNLYDNVLKYGEADSKVTVTARVKGDHIINDFIHIAAVPLTADAVEQIFTRGFRAEEARRARASGTGTGMWISRSLMRAMKGDLRAYPTDSARRTRFSLIWRAER